MSSIIAIVVGVLIVVIVALLMVKYRENQNLMCPHCQLEFVSDLFLIQDNCLLACPFCHHWILVTKSFDKYVTKNRLEIILQFLKGNPSLTLPFPVRGFVYLGNFHLMHIFAFLFIIGLFSSFILPGIGARVFMPISFLLTLYFAYQYVKWNFAMEPKNKFWAWCKMKYLTNLSFIQGGLKDFKKYKILCVEPSF